MSPTLRAVTLLLGAVVLLSGCSGFEGTGDKGYVTGDGQITQLDVSERGDPIDLTGEDLDGDAMDLADLRGGVAVVNVWGSWCPPCRVEMPDLVEAAAQTDGTAEFVGVNIRDSDTSQSEAFVRNFDVPYPSFYSPDGQALLPFSGTLTPNSVPSTVVLDPEGRVAASVIGELPSAQTLVTLVEDVAAESSVADGGGRG